MRGATKPLNRGLLFLKFQLTHPMRGATILKKLIFSLLKKFQLTHPMRGATIVHRQELCEQVISTHTPHAGCDYQLQNQIFRYVNFNSHTPCGVRHVTQKSNFTDNSKFQLTHPMRGATCWIWNNIDSRHFNSHTPCGVRLTSIAFSGV